MNSNDIITAISTPTGSGAIGIIRISGDNIFPLLKNFFYTYKTETQFSEFKPKKVYLLKLRIPERKSFLDIINAVYYKSPKSYTGEDMMELYCHNSSYILNTIMESLLDTGIRLAEPGEFTKRAFLNNKLDLTAAEAVADIIQSSSELEHKIAFNSLTGKLYNTITEIENILFNILVEIEADIDFAVDNDDVYINRTNWKSNSEFVINKIDTLINTFNAGYKISHGYNIAIAGKPNVGKSELFNNLVGHKRAIVTEIPGTTRDYIEARVSIGKYKINLFDTAGLRETAEKIEYTGINLSKEIIDSADLIIFITDLSDRFTKQDETILKFIENKNYITVGNKNDLNIINNHDTDINISALKSNNINRLIEYIENSISKMTLSAVFENNDIIITNVRQKDILKKVSMILKTFTHNFDNKSPVEMLAEDIRESINLINEVTGKNINETILNEIFTRFCIGK